MQENQMNNIFISGNLKDLINNYKEFKEPKVTCGILTYNENDLIINLLKSISDEFDNIKVLDANSTDQTVPKIKKFDNSIEIIHRDWKMIFHLHVIC